jgi:hypothetical protein
MSAWFPFPDDGPTNNPDWGESGTVSTWNWTNHQLGVFKAINRIVLYYADMTFINANINTVIPDMGTSFFDANNLNLSEAKVFSYIGITEWPSVINPNATELKQWYDILKLLTHVYMCDNRGNAGNGIAAQKLATEWSGIMQGGVYHDEASSGSEVKFGAGNPPWPDLADLSTDYGSFGLDWDAISLSEYYFTATRQYLKLNTQKLTDTGYSRDPLESKCWGQWDITIRPSSGSDINDPTNTAAYLVTEGLTDLELIEFPVTVSRNAADITYNANESKLTFPTLADGIGMIARRQLRFFDNYNDPTGTTGFQYYTP